MFPKLPSIGKDINNRLIISPQNNEFTYTTTAGSIIDTEVDTLKKTKRIKAKSKNTSRNNVNRKNERKLNTFKSLYLERNTANNSHVQKEFARMVLSQNNIM
jgi:hypothetical protein